MIDVVRQILCRLEPGLCVCTAGSRIITSFGDASSWHPWRARVTEFCEKACAAAENGRIEPKEGSRHGQVTRERK